MRRTSFKRKSPLIEIAKIVVGGAVGVAFAFLIINFVRGTGWFKRDASNRATGVSIALADRRSLFVQHSDFRAHTGEVGFAKRLNATFEIVPGLSDSKGISFRSVRPPNHYLAHGDFRVGLGVFDNSAEGARNATFLKVKGLSSPSDVSFESVNWPGYFLRSRSNGQIWLDKNDGSVQFRRDATFVIVEPPDPSNLVRVKEKAADNHLTAGSNASPESATIQSPSEPRAGQPETIPVDSASPLDYSFPLYAVIDCPGSA
jgi:hypothetical protein